MKTKKTFDCVKITRDIRDKLHEDHKNMKNTDLIEYYAKIKQETLALRENSAPYGEDKK
jgi:hypothetical protein